MQLALALARDLLDGGELPALCRVAVVAPEGPNLRHLLRGDTIPGDDAAAGAVDGGVDDC